MRAHGRDVELLSAADLADRFPALEAGDVAVAAVARDAGYLDPHSYVAAMADRARRAGAAVRTGTEVALDRPAAGGDDDESGGDDSPGSGNGDGGARLRTPDGFETFDSVLVAAGAHSRRLLADAGHAIATKPYRVQALVTDPLDAVSSAGVPTTYDATGGYYLRPCEGGLLAGDGVETGELDPDGYDETADGEFREATLDRVRVALADPDTVTVSRAWAGLCTATPDRNPLLGPVADGLFVATGWHGHGFMRAPALGETVARQVLGGDGLDAFDPRRFDGDEEFDAVEGMAVEE